MAVHNSVETLRAGWPSRSGRVSPMCCGRWSRRWPRRSCRPGGGWGGAAGFGDRAAVEAARV